ncbi:MAG TPA: NAD(P)-dependent alcohol dehydrogenase, partial [Herpetosiphonaceae bacterium]
MRAIICTAYGAPDVLQLRQAEKPVPAEHEVLIKIHAAVVGPSDCAFRKGEPFIVKLIYGLSKPRLQTQGVEFAGRVEAVGGAVTSFAPGDEVFGMSPNTFGAHADYLRLPATKPLTRKSPQMSYEAAVAICDGAPTALTFLRDKARIQPGQQVLINGASGAVGVYAVQLAKHFGAEVTGVCSGANVELVASLGADHVIDYAKEDFAAGGRR